MVQHGTVSPWRSICIAATSRNVRRAKGASIVHAAGGMVRPTGPSGMEHEFWRSRLRERCEQHNYTVTEEFHLGERKRADFHAKRHDRVILIEVETGESDVQENIRKCSEHELVLFFTNQRAHDSERDHIPKNVAVLTPETISNLHEILTMTSWAELKLV